MFSISIHACNCRNEWSIDFYSFLKNEKNIFVGRVKSVSKTDKYLNYELIVIDKLRGNFRTTELIHSSTNPTCQLRLMLDSVYLIQVSKIWGKWYSGQCSYKVRSSEKEFTSSINLIMAFKEKKDIFIRSHYFIGRLHQGKRIGHWIYFSHDTMCIDYEMSYNKGKKIRKWFLEGSENSYKSGKFMGMSEITSDNLTVQVIKTTNQWAMYYLNGHLYKLITNKKYRVYYPNGAIKEKATIKDGVIKGFWIKYDEKGKVSERIGEEDNHLLHDIDLYRNQQKLEAPN